LAGAVDRLLAEKQGGIQVTADYEKTVDSRAATGV